MGLLTENHIALKRLIFCDIFSKRFSEVNIPTQGSTPICCTDVVQIDRFRRMVRGKRFE